MRETVENLKPRKRKVVEAAAAKPVRVKSRPKEEKSLVSARKTRTGRKSGLEGMKIKRKARAVNPARKGTLRRALVDAVLSAKSVDGVLGVEVSNGEKVAKVTPADIRFCVGNGLIELV